MCFYLRFHSFVPAKTINIDPVIYIFVAASIIILICYYCLLISFSIRHGRYGQPGDLIKPFSLCYHAGIPASRERRPCPTFPFAARSRPLTTAGDYDCAAFTFRQSRSASRLQSSLLFRSSCRSISLHRLFAPFRPFFFRYTQCIHTYVTNRATLLR